MSMNARISTNVGAPMIKSYGTEAITKKSREHHYGAEMTGKLDIDPAQLPEVPTGTMIVLSVGDISNLNLLANLSDTTFGIAQESNKPYTASEYTANSTTR